MIKQILLSLLLLISFFALSEEKVDKSIFMPVGSSKECTLCIWVDIKIDPDSNTENDKFRYCVGKIESKPEDLLLLSKEFSQKKDLIPLIQKIAKKNKGLAKELELIHANSIQINTDFSLFAKTLLDILIQLKHAECTKKELDAYLLEAKKPVQKIKDH